MCTRSAFSFSLLRHDILSLQLRKIQPAHLPSDFGRRDRQKKTSCSSVCSLLCISGIRYHQSYICTRPFHSPSFVFIFDSCNHLYTRQVYRHSSARRQQYHKPNRRSYFAGLSATLSSSKLGIIGMFASYRRISNFVSHVSSHTDLQSAFHRTVHLAIATREIRHVSPYARPKPPPHADAFISHIFHDPVLI